MAFTGYKSCTIDHTKCGAQDSLNFPVLVSVTDADLKATGSGGSYVTSNSGYDIGFYSDSALTTKLDWEVERYIASTGEFIAWVRIGTVSHTTDTVFYMAIGDSSITTDQSNKNGVWNSNYKLVWHLGDGTTLSATDSTSNADNGTLTNTPTATTGQIDGAASIASASSQHIDEATAANTDVSTVTFSCWVNPTTLANAYNAVMSKVLDTSHYIQLMLKSNGKLYYGIKTAGGDKGSDGGGSHTLSTGTWYYTVLSYGSVSGFKGYVNGASDVTGSGGSSITTSNTAKFEVGNDTFTSGRLFNGKVDEVRVSNTNYLDDWVLTEYNNQNSPSTFITFGSFVANVTTLTQTVSDTITLSDTLGFNLTFEQANSDSVSLSDSLTQIATGELTFSDTNAFSDTLGYNATGELGLNDTLSLLDGQNLLGSDELGFNDSFTITDSINPLGTYNGAYTDDILLTDSLQLALQFGFFFTDTMSLTDFLDYSVTNVTPVTPQYLSYLRRYLNDV